MVIFFVFLTEEIRFAFPSITIVDLHERWYRIFNPSTSNIIALHYKAEAVAISATTELKKNFIFDLLSNRYVSSFLPNSEELLQSNNDRHALPDELSQNTSSEAP
jgi:hypothetical protein